MFLPHQPRPTIAALTTNFSSEKASGFYPNAVVAKQCPSEGHLGTIARAARHLMRRRLDANCPNIRLGYGCDGRDGRDVRGVCTGVSEQTHSSHCPLLARRGDRRARAHRRSEIERAPWPTGGG